MIFPRNIYWNIIQVKTTEEDWKEINKNNIISWNTNVELDLLQKNCTLSNASL